MIFLLTACGVSGDQISVNKPQHKGSNAKKRIAGVLICAGFIASVIWKRIKAKKNGYQQSNLYGDIAKCVIITAVAAVAFDVISKKNRVINNNKETPRVRRDNAERYSLPQGVFLSFCNVRGGGS